MEKKVIELAEKISFVSHSVPGQGPTNVSVEKIIIRPFTQEECFKHWDKRLAFEQAASRQISSNDLYDNGDEEIIQTIESPPPDITRDMLEEKPALCDALVSWLYECAGLTKEVKRATEYQIDPALVNQYLGRVIAIDIDGTVVVFQKLSRMVYKILQKDMAVHGFILGKNLASEVKKHIISENKDEFLALCQDKPFILLAIGKILLQETSIKINEFAGKA